MGVGCGATIRFELGCATEVRERSNEDVAQNRLWQLHIRIKSMWLRRVYFVLLKFLRAKNCGTEATGCVETLRNMRRPYVPRLFMRNAEQQIWSTPRNIVGGRI